MKMQKALKLLLKADVPTAVIYRQSWDVGQYVFFDGHEFLLEVDGELSSFSPRPADVKNDDWGTNIE